MDFFDHEGLADEKNKPLALSTRFPFTEIETGGKESQAPTKSFAQLRFLHFMQPPPIPPNESERLAALRHYDILDTPAEADFDDFTRLASQICGTPMATIALIDAARQWFKSNRGMEASETSRDTSFCGHVILGSEILEVPNALEEPLANSSSSF